jgi:hypothetical protein
VHMRALYAFDPATAKQLWVNMDAESGYGTPAIYKSQSGVDLIVTPGGDVVRLDNGKTVNTKIGHANYASPVVSDHVIYFGGPEVSAVQLGTTRDDFKDQELWSHVVVGEVIGSPVCHDNLLFLVTTKGELYVFKAGTKGGPTPLVDKRPLMELEKEEGQSAPSLPVAYASVTLAGNHLYVATTKGEVLILEATAEAKEVGRVKMPKGTPCTPVFAGKEMFLRDGERLFCIGK